MSYVLVVRMTARAGEQDRAVELLTELVPASRAEPGCEVYVAHRDPEDPRTFCMYEAYADEDAFKAHGATEHFQRLAAGELFGLMEERRREVYEPLPVT